MIWIALLAGAALAALVGRGDERRAALMIAGAVLLVQAWKAPAIGDNLRWLLFCVTWTVTAGAMARHLDTTNRAILDCATLTLLSGMCYAAGAAAGLPFGLFGARIKSPLFWTDIALALAIASAGGRGLVLVGRSAGVALVRGLGLGSAGRASGGASAIVTAHPQEIGAQSPPVRGRYVR